MAGTDSPCYLLLTAAGSSVRFEGGKKECLSIDGISVLRRALEPFISLQNLRGIVITVPKGKEEELRASLEMDSLAGLTQKLALGIAFVEGGSTRQESVRKGLEFLSFRNTFPSPIVLIHDGARPWVSEALVRAVLEGTRLYGACIPLVDLADTPKILGSGLAIQGHPERSAVKAAQTPQGFSLGELSKAHRMAAQESWACTDDASLWDRYIGPVYYVAGERKNIKITYREDLGPMEMPGCRIGEGWDIHPLVEGRPLLLGGYRIDFPRGEAGHSDGDALWHAVIDALLGAAGLGDIGSHFPPSDAKWKDADSSLLAAKAVALVRAQGWEIGNIDCTVMLEKPRLQPYREAIQARMGEVLDLEPGKISVKAKSYEGFGEVGEGLAVETRAVVLLVQGRRQAILRNESK